MNTHRKAVLEAVGMMIESNEVLDHCRPIDTLTPDVQSKINGRRMTLMTLQEKFVAMYGKNPFDEALDYLDELLVGFPAGSGVELRAKAMKFLNKHRGAEEGG